MYDYLLANGDKLRDLPRLVKMDIQDYAYMREAHLFRKVKWEAIRSIWVTEHGVTIWQLTEKYLNSEPERAIGTYEPPLNLIYWILQK